MLTENEYKQGKSIKILISKIKMEDIRVNIEANLNLLMTLQKSLISLSDSFFAVQIPKSVLDVKNDFKLDVKSYSDGLLLSHMTKESLSDKKNDIHKENVGAYKTFDPAPNPNTANSKESSIIDINNSQKLIKIRNLEIQLVIDNKNMPILSQSLIYVHKIDI